MVCRACPDSLVAGWVLRAVLLAAFVVVRLAFCLERCRSSLCCCCPDRAVIKGTSLLRHATQFHVNNLVLLNNVFAIPFPTSMRAALSAVALIFAFIPDLVKPECLMKWTVLHTWLIIVVLFYADIVYLFFSKACCKDQTNAHQQQ